MRFLLLYHGPATPPDASHEGWPEWFSNLGDKLVERGSPMADGLALLGDGSTKSSTAQLNGYSVIQADDLDQALSLVGVHPYLNLGDEYSIEIHSIS
jgi:hypothetical protein